MPGGYVTSLRRFLTFTDVQKTWWAVHGSLCYLEWFLHWTWNRTLNRVSVFRIARMRLMEGGHKAFTFIKESDRQSDRAVVISARNGGPYWQELDKQGSFKSVSVDPKSELHKELMEILRPVEIALVTAKRAARRKMMQTGVRKEGGDD